EQNAYNILSQILDDKSCEIGHYLQEQQTAIILVTLQTVSLEKLKSNSSKNYNNNDQKQYCKKLPKIELGVQ
ncbi:14419_t:CDS:1, partial [Cetraspora pellucida]